MANRNCSKGFIRTTPSASVCYYTDSIQAICTPPTCAKGISNLKPELKRTTLGWTDPTMATKITEQDLTIKSKIHLMNRVSFQVNLGGVQYGNFSNLYLEMNLGSPSKTISVQEFGSGTLFIKRGNIISNCALPNPVITGTAAKPILTFDLSGCLPNNQVVQDDSVWVVLNMALNDANKSATTLELLAASSAHFYNLENNIKQFCGAYNYDFYYLNPSNALQINSTTVNNCNGTLITLYYEGRHNLSTDVTPNEYRPIKQLDSIMIPIPYGYTVDMSNPATAVVARAREYVNNNTFTAKIIPTTYNYVGNDFLGLFKWC